MGYIDHSFSSSVLLMQLTGGVLLFFGLFFIAIAAAAVASCYTHTNLLKMNEESSLFLSISSFWYFFFAMLLAWAGGGRFHTWTCSSRAVYTNATKKLRVLFFFLLLEGEWILFHELRRRPCPWCDVPCFYSTLFSLQCSLGRRVFFTSWAFIHSCYLVTSSSSPPCINAFLL